MLLERYDGSSDARYDTSRLAQASADCPINTAAEKSRSVCRVSQAFHH